MSNPFAAAIYMLEEHYRRNAELVIHPATDNILAHQNIIILRTETTLHRLLWIKK